tara:strand:+ start:10005 stop:10514 length:510 start_codon:yes stop_codon:yes gene_type:complete
MRLLAFILITLLFSCKASKQEKKTEELNVKTVEAREEVSAVAFTEVKSGENSDYKKAQNLIITTQEEMDLNWSKMFGKYPRKPPIPMVDFETKQLLLVAMGEQATGGYTIKVSSIEKTTKGILVTIEDAKPGKACNNTSALIYPFQLIEMPKTEKEITFARVSKINACK